MILVAENTSTMRAPIKKRSKIRHNFIGNISEVRFDFNTRPSFSTKKSNSSRFNLFHLRTNLDILKGIGRLKENWNGYGAKAIPVEVIESASRILKKLEFQPKIFPTGRGSVQFEYEKSNGDYLEFEIFVDKIGMYSEIDGSEEEIEIDPIKLFQESSLFNGSK